MTDAPNNAETKAAGKAKRNQMDTTKTLKVSAWVEKNRVWILTETPSFVDAAREAAAGLKFPITPGNLAHIVRSMGFPWPGRLDTEPADAIRMLRNDLGYIAKLMMGNMPGVAEGMDRLKRIAAMEKEELFDGHSH